MENYQAGSDIGTKIAESISGNNQQMGDQNIIGQPSASNDYFGMDDSMPFLWDPVDPGFESMIELFPDSWPL